MTRQHPEKGAGHGWVTCHTGCHLPSSGCRMKGRQSHPDKSSWLDVTAGDAGAQQAAAHVQYIQYSSIMCCGCVCLFTQGGDSMELVEEET